MAPKSVGFHIQLFKSSFHSRITRDTFRGKLSRKRSAKVKRRLNGPKKCKISHSMVLDAIFFEISLGTLLGAKCPEKNRQKLNGD